MTEFVKIEDQIASSETPALVVMYGPAGAGKTTLASTFPKPILFMDFDGKMRSIFGTKGVYSLEYKLKNPEDASNLFAEIKKDWKKIRNGKLDTPEGPPKTVVWDSLTSYDSIAIQHYVISAGKQVETYKPTRNIYGDLASHYYMLLPQWQALNTSWFVILAHVYNREDSEGAVIASQPWMTGKKVADKLPAAAEELWYLEKGNKGTPILYYKPRKLMIANSVILKGDGRLVDPTFDKIMEEAKK